MNGLVRRAYSGVEDLRRMQAAVAAAYAHTWWRTGDLAWAARNLSHLEIGVWLTLWEAPSDPIAAGTPVAWVWPSANGWVDHFVAPECAGPELLTEMIACAEARIEAAAAAGDPREPTTFTVAASDHLMLDLLRTRGYEPIAEAFDVNRRTLEEIAVPILPAGHRLSAVNDDRVEGRVEAQRAAFAPSTLTVERYGRVRRSAPYTPELDRVVLDPDGKVVAFCTAWLDAVNQAGLLEPVGTRPSHQRKGLATAVCLDALHALRDAKALTAQVSCETGSGGCATYRAAGFTVVEHVLAMRRAGG